MTLAEELAKKHHPGYDEYGVFEQACIAAINEAIERCAEEAINEKVEEVGPGDDAYNMAIRHVVDAIRALKG